MSRNRHSSSRGPASPVRSDADRIALEFLAEQRIGIAPQLARRLDVSVGAAQRRIVRLEQRRLVAVEPLFRAVPPAVLITAAGLRAIDSPLPVPRVDLQGYRHDLGVGWLWLAAQEGAFGSPARVVSEREMRSSDARLGRASAADRQPAPYGVGIGGVGPTGLPQRHYPDLLLALPGQRTIALELELTAKGPRRLEQIMRGYAGDPRIDTVLYLVPDRRLGETIATAARAAGVSTLVRVNLLAGANAIEGAPPVRSRAAARGPARTAQRPAATSRRSCPQRGDDGRSGGLAGR